MTCKYFDCGWCYAPEDVEHNSKNGSCIEPLSCPYLKKNKTLMTEKEHLECEIKELELEIEQHGKAIQNLINVQTRRKQKLEELERQKPITLQRIIEECMVGRNREIQLDLVENILDRVEVEFFPKLGSIEPPLYNDGWEDCLKELKGRLRE
jgi:molybdopterin converting factor small subunit